MDSAQAISFFLGLDRIENSYAKIGRFKGLSSFVLIIKEPETKEIRLKPLDGIEKHGELWRKIEVLFDEVRNRHS